MDEVPGRRDLGQADLADRTGHLAEAHGLGRSEQILGAALASHGLRDTAFVATKIFPILPLAPVVRQRAAASARRLGLSRIDLYQVHQPNPVVRDGTTMAGMRELQRDGLVGEVGVSNYSLARWQAAERALGSRVLSNQVQLSLAHPGPLDDLVPFAQEQGRIVIAWSPLAQGLLSGRYDASNRPSGGIRAVNSLVVEENLIRAQVALAWLIHHPGVVVIPGASSIAQIEANAAAADITLTDDEAAELTAQARRFQPISGVAAARGLASGLLHR